MREILFKAKTISGNWVNGLLANKDDKWYISNKAGMPFAYDVRPETICQFTGLYDKNGKKIWENDILKTWDDQYAQVKFGLYNTGFASGDYNQGFYAAFSEDSYYRHELGYWRKESYVIGNIFDNKELLQEEHK